MAYRIVAGVALAALLWAGGTLGPLDQKPQAPTFRTGIVLVPVDVRVLDRDGKPVSDLKKEDFAIVEDGVPQQISLFERQTLVDREAGPEFPLILDQTRRPEVRLQDRRVFFVVLGRYWLPRAQFGMVDAITRFLRKRLLPQDYAAVSAWGRATDVTTDHEAVAQVVERLRAYLESIDGSRERRDKTLALYNAFGRPTPPAIQAELDAVFEVGSVAGRSLPPRVARPEIRSLLEQIERHAAAVASAANPPSPQYSPGGGSGKDLAARAIAQVGTSHVLNIFSAVQYLRLIEGEKHLLYFPASEMYLPALEDDRGLARIASDARVVIHVIRAEGLPTRLRTSPSSAGPSLLYLESTMASKHVAELTGGEAFTNDYPDRALAHIDLITRSGYLLGYYPSNPNLDRRHRKLKVTVARPRGASVMYRRSYVATDVPEPYDERQFIVQDRIMTAGEYDREIRDIAVKLKASIKPRAVAVEVVIDLSRVSVASVDGRQAGTLELAFFCADSRERVVGEVWQKLDLKLKEDTYQRALTEGLRYTADVPIEGTARYVKVVVYDYGSDRVGSAIVRVY